MSGRLAAVPTTVGLTGPLVDVSVSDRCGGPHAEDPHWIFDIS